ncbi:MAG: ABC transporter ATP-binding protein [Patescibacteria group bacterium]
MKKITKQTYVVFWQHVRRYQLFFWIILISIALASVVPIIVPFYYKKFIDELVFSQASNIAEVVVQLKGIIWFILLLNAIEWLFYRIATYTNNYFQPKVIADLNNTSFEYLHNHSFGFFTNRFVGALVRKIGRLVRGFEDIADSLYWNLMPTAIRVLSVTLVLFWLYPTLGFILLAWTLLYLTINYFLTLRLLRLNEAAATQDSRVTAYLADTITNSANVKVFTGLAVEQAGFGELTAEQYRLTKKSWDYDSNIETIQGAFMAILEFAIFYAAISLWQRGLLTIGGFVLIQSYIIQVFMRLWDFGRVIRRIYRHLADAEEMVEILNTPHQVKDVHGATKLQVIKGEVEFKNINFTYTKELEVIKNFNLKVLAGEKVGLVGPSGAGKSTLVSLMFRFYDVPDGAIYIDNQNITEVTQNSLRRQVSLVPQDPVLFHRTLMENIRYGKTSATNQEVIAAAKLAHCDEFIDRLPNGYQTYVGERGVKLSGGERQRVAIARAILKNAPILVLDEATSSLDSHTEGIIQDALVNLMKGKTTLVIAHRLSTIMKMDRIIVMRHGEIQETGTHQELLKKSGGVYHTLWQLQAGGFIA